MDLELAIVERATNNTCMVRLVGGTRLTDAHYSAAIRSNFILIQPRHVVAVDRRVTPMQVVWRLGSIATVVAREEETITYNVGAAGGPNRPANTVPLHDLRPEDERDAPLERGVEVVIGPGPEKGVPAILDTTVDGRPAHPERFRARLPDLAAKLQPAA
jgi:hypothetical protein